MATDDRCCREGYANGAAALVHLGNVTLQCFNFLPYKCRVVIELCVLGFESNDILLE